MHFPPRRADPSAEGHAVWPLFDGGKDETDDDFRAGDKDGVRASRDVPGR